MFAPEFYRQYKSWIQKAASNWKKSYLTCKENNEPLHNYKGIADTKEVLYSAMKKEIAEALGVDADALWGNEYENNPGYRQLILDQLKKNHQNPPVTLNDFSHIHKQRTGTIKAYENYLKIIEKYTALPANEREERLAKLFGGMEKEDFKAYLDDEQVSVEFLQKILELLYNAGEYAFIADFVLDKLESRIGRNDKRQFKIIAAHIYGSAPVGRYAEAVALLSSINEASFEEYADNKTAMISNILRNAFVLSESDKAAVTKLLYEVLNAYANICQHHPHYPARWCQVKFAI
jgi:hypothetical protein